MGSYGGRYRDKEWRMAPGQDEWNGVDPSSSPY